MVDENKCIVMIICNDNVYKVWLWWWALELKEIFKKIIFLLLKKIFIWHNKFVVFPPALSQRDAASDGARWSTDCDCGWERAERGFVGRANGVARAPDGGLPAESAHGHSTPAVGLPCGGPERIQCMGKTGKFEFFNEIK